MNKERFQSLAAAYGGTISRWPVAERRAARWLAFWSGRQAREYLRSARRLDRILQRSEGPELGPGLRDSLLAGARCLSEKSRQQRPWFGAALGAGLVTACAAGIGTGFVIAPLTTIDSLTSPMDPAEASASALGNPTEFGDG